MKTNVKQTHKKIYLNKNNKKKVKEKNVKI